MALSTTMGYRGSHSHLELFRLQIVCCCTSLHSVSHVSPTKKPLPLILPGGGSTVEIQYSKQMFNVGGREAEICKRQAH